MHVLVTGATGYLGKLVIAHAQAYARVSGLARAISPNASKASLYSIDVTDVVALDELVGQLRPDAIIHTAAANPGADEACMDAINHRGAGHIAAVASRYGCRLVAVSTDMVHSGRDAPYADDAEPSPLQENPYACSKAHAEVAIAANCADAVVVRTSLIYGLHEMDRGTAGFVARLASGQPLQLFNDVLRQPVHVNVLAECLCKLAFEHTACAGPINLVGEEVLSRAEFGLTLLDWWGERQPGIREISAQDIAGVPMDLRLSLSGAHALGLPTPGVTIMLQEGRDWRQFF